MSKIIGLHTKPSLPPVIQRITTAGSGTWNRSYVFQIAPGSATAGATYTNNGITYTVSKTVSSGTQVTMTGSNVPTNTGQLTKTGGTGDAVLNFVAVFKCTSLLVKLLGGGAGGGGTGGGATTGTNGNQSTFGSSLLTAPSGTGGPAATGVGGGASSAPTINSPFIAVRSVVGCAGSPTTGNISNAGGGDGGSSYITGVGVGGTEGIENAQAAPANSGGGGGGGFAIGGSGAGGGGAGSYLEAIAYGTDIAATYSYTVGARANGGTGTQSGGSGGEGLLETVENFE